MRRLAGQRAQHVQLAGGFDHEPVGRPGDVRVFRPRRNRSGGEVAGEDHHRHQPHTVHVRNHAADQRRRGEYERGASAQGTAIGRGRRLRRVRYAGGRDAGARDNDDVGNARVHGFRAPRRAAAGRVVGEKKGDGRQGNAERRGQGDIHFGQLETEKKVAHDQHVRARTVRELQRDAAERQERRHVVPSTRPTDQSPPIIA